MRGEWEEEKRKIVSQPHLHSIKNCQSFATSDQNPPSHPTAPLSRPLSLCSTNTLIPLLLTVSQRCPRLNVNPLLRVTEEWAREGKESAGVGKTSGELSRTVAGLFLFWRSHPRRTYSFFIWIMHLLSGPLSPGQVCPIVVQCLTGGRTGQVHLTLVIMRHTSALSVPSSNKPIKLQKS